VRQTTVGRYLVTRLEQCGLRHVFGIPGDYVLGFYDLLVDSRIRVVGTCTEIGAGFAADAYARVTGLGAACVTYCVGGFNILNAVAGAYAEKSPLVLISGAPGLGERARSTLLHHKVRDYGTQREIYERVTVAAEALEDPTLVPRQVDRALALCLTAKRPIYLELPRDVVDRPCAAPGPWRLPAAARDPAAIAEATAEAVAMIRRARRPVVLAGVEIHRFGLQRRLVRLLERTGLPVAATLLGKSVVRETHPQYLGVYEGAIGREDVRRAVESSDCLLLLGAFLTDIDLGVATAPLDESRTIDATAERVSIRHHHYDDVPLGDFMAGLTRALPQRRGRSRQCPIPPAAPYAARSNAPITVRRFFRRLNDFLDQRSVVICDIGDSLFGAADLTIHERTEFLSPAYYTSMGFAVPAALGVHMARPGLRPIVVVGDGAFQMTGLELSSLARYGGRPLVFVLNNRGYTTERCIHEGPYNDVHEWAYHLVPQLLRSGHGHEVRTESDFERVLAAARRQAGGFTIVNVHLDTFDRSPALDRLTRRLGRRAGLSRRARPAPPRRRI
jgi:indolepyruvate decarboxylase